MTCMMHLLFLARTITRRCQALVTLVCAIFFDYVHAWMRSHTQLIYISFTSIRNTCFMLYQIHQPKRHKFPVSNSVGQTMDLPHTQVGLRLAPPGCPLPPFTWQSFGKMLRASPCHKHRLPLHKRNWRVSQDLQAPDS